MEWCLWKFNPSPKWTWVATQPPSLLLSECLTPRCTMTSLALVSDLHSYFLKHQIFSAFDSVFYASQKLKEEEENREALLNAAKVLQIFFVDL